MYIGVGRLSSRTLSLLRELEKKYSNLIVYPRFFDSKGSLLSGRGLAEYIYAIQQNIDKIEIALWPDFYYSENLKNYPIRWIFPLHSTKELDFVLKIEPAFIGYPSQQIFKNKLLRDYSLAWFLSVAKNYDFKIWYLGANRTELKQAITFSFDGADITARTCGYLYDSRHNALEVAKCIEEIILRIK